MKKSIERFCVRFPKIYQFVQTCRTNSNSDKFIFSKFVKRGHTVIDCGANIGYYTNFLRTLVGKRGFVHAFEPVPSTFENLQRNTRQYWSVNNCSLNMTGLYKDCSKLIAYIPNSISGHASISNHLEVWKSSSTEEISIQLTTLDSYALQNVLEKIDFIKIDIEGAEIDALRGAKITLVKHKPTLHLEVNSQLLKSTNQQPRDLIEFLKPLGYENFHYYDENPTRLKSFEKLVASKVEINTNVIATA